MSNEPTLSNEPNLSANSHDQHHQQHQTILPDVGATTTEGSGDYHKYEDEDDQPKANKEWDEGGPSDCGYSTGVHDTLMFWGGKVHGIVGDPSPGMNSAMKAIGNWFQEAAYAVRDLRRGGDHSLHEDTTETITTMQADAKKAFCHVPVDEEE